MDNNIKGKVIVITGASSGLGEAAAKHLAKEGGIVVLAARRREKIEELAAQIVSNGGQALARETDVTKAEEVKALVDTAVQTFGKIDVMINNAGVMPLAPLERLKIAEWNQMIDVNIRGVLHGIAAVLPYMKEQKSGHIINLSSVAGHLVWQGSAVYSATKYAVRAITEGLRQETKPYNIRTTIVSPGSVATNLLNSIGEADIAEATRRGVESIAIPAESFARVVAFAISQPQEVDVNEVLFRPLQQQL